MADRDECDDEDWPLFEKGRNDGYRAWNGKGHRLPPSVTPGEAAYEITKQAAREGICAQDSVSQSGYYTGARRGLKGDPLEGVTDSDE